MRRLSLLLLLLLVPAGLSGCGNKHEGPVLFAETEGIYLEVGELKYQVQISRQLNPQDTEDLQFVKGRTVGQPPTDEETYFGVFVRVQNDQDEAHTTTGRFEIEDTVGKVYTPELINPKENPFVYRSTTLAPGDVYPPRESPAGEGPIGGGMLLFKIPLDALYNRPLEFRIFAPENEDEVGVVDLDV